MSPAFVLYLASCAAVGFLGRHRRIGFLGFLIVSILLTPILALLVLLLTAETPLRGQEQ